MDIENNIQIALKYLKNDDPEQALRVCAKALETLPDNADMLHLLGSIYYQIGDYASAIQHMEKAHRLNPDNAEILHNLCNALSETDRLDDAIACYKKMLKTDTGSPEAYNNLGFLLLQKGGIDDAIHYLQKAILLKPDYYDASYNLGISLQEKGRIDEAITFYRKAIQISQEYPEAYNNLGFALQEKGRIDEAITFYRKAIQISQEYPEAYNNLGFALQERGRPDEAIACYRRAIEIMPEYPEAYNNLGNAFHEKGRLDDALKCFQKAIKINPEFASAHWNKALVHLLTGDFSEGWREYKWFWKLRGVEQRDYSQPVWDGSPVDSGTIFLYAEQGYGDTIQFVRYIPLVAERCARVIVECQKELVPLVERMEGVYRVIACGEKIPRFDAYASLLMLPMIFQTTVASIPSEAPYLKTDPVLVQKWTNLLKNDNPNLRFGLVWSGGHKEGTLHNRFFSLDLFSRLAGLEGITLYSLQKGPAVQQEKDLMHSMKIIDHMDNIHDFQDTAALIENIDLVISVDTSVAHLAGALGKPVWLLTPFSPNWKWFQSRDDSPWYPTMRLFRQPEPGDWESVIKCVGQALKQYIEEKTKR